MLKFFKMASVPRAFIRWLKLRSLRQKVSSKLGLVVKLLLLGGSLIASFSTSFIQEVKAVRAISGPAVFFTVGTDISGSINVTSTDGKTWSKIHTTKLSVPINLHLSHNNGYVTAYKIDILGIPLAHHIAAPLKPTDLYLVNTMKGDTSRIMDRFSREIFSECNNKLSKGKGIRETHSFTYQAHTSLFAWFRWASNEKETIVRQFKRDVTVNCLAYKKPTTDFQIGERPFKNLKAKIFLTTVNGNNASGAINPGNVCPALKITTRIETNQKGLVDVKLWRKQGNNISSELLHLQSHFEPAKGKFFARSVKWEKFDNTTYIQFKAEVLGSPFEPQTPWKDITVHCSGHGGGGFATPTSGNSNPISTSNLQGGFQLLDNSKKAKRNRCERKGKALIWFNTRQADNIHYSLDCGELGNFSGTLKPTSMGGGKYKAGKLISFAIKNTIDAGCTLRTVAPGQPKNHQFTHREFTCHKTTGNGAGDGFVAPRNPGTSIPHSGRNGRPTKIVDPARTSIRCHVGKLVRGQCVCSASKKRKKIGNRAFRCIAKPRPKRIKTICQGGTKRGTICICPKKTKWVRLGPHKYRCVSARKPSRKNPGVRKNPKKDTRRLVCLGGKPAGKKCLCPRGKKPIRASVLGNSYRCVKKAVRRNPTGTRRNQRGVRRNLCHNGKVFLRGQCVRRAK